MAGLLKGLWDLFFIGYISGLTIVASPLPYGFIASLGANITLFDMFITLLPLHIGVLGGLVTNIWLIKRYGRRALFLPILLFVSLWYAFSG